MEIYTERKNCRICDGALKTVIDLGNIAINDFVDDNSEVLYSPLTLVHCAKCGLTQLKHTTNQDILYRNYWYLSGINKGMREALKDIVKNVKSRVQLEEGDTVIDIGCNDGTMLSYYDLKLTRIGFDPAKNLKDQAERNCDIFYNTYFGNEEIKTPLAKAITSIAMFYDLEDPRKFIELIKKSLHPKGLWVVQFTDLLSMFKINAYDNITHEHLEYYSFYVLKNLMEEHGLQIFDVSTNSVNGYSVRAYISWSGAYAVNPSVAKHLEAERKYMKQFVDPFVAFAERCYKLKADTLAFINKELEKGKTIAAMGASSKGNTLLQFLELDSTKIAYAGEVSPAKFGKKTVATNIPIIPENEAVKRNPDFFLLLPWHFVDSLKEKHADYLKNGGHFIVPCPELEII